MSTNFLMYRTSNLNRKASIAFLLFPVLLFTRIHALPTTSTQTEVDLPDNSWSIEAILGLAAIVVAVICSAAGIAWPGLYRQIKSRRAHTSSCMIIIPYIYADAAHVNSVPFESVS